MLLTNKHVVHQPNIHLNGEVLKRAHIFKYLGIYLDDKVKFNAHIDYLKSRLSQYCGITLDSDAILIQRQQKQCTMPAYFPL